MVSEQLRAAAYHEAGHAVLAFRRELNIGLVTIRPGGRSLGSVIYEDYGPFDSSDYRAEGGFERISNVMLALLAGPAAERWCAGGRILISETWDEDTVAEVASKVCGGGKEASGFLDCLRIMTDRWFKLKSIQRCTQAVSDALLDHGTLAGDDARRTIVAAWRAHCRGVG
jgi:hypothetical protein